MKGGRAGCVEEMEAAREATWEAVARVAGERVAAARAAVERAVAAGGRGEGGSWRWQVGRSGMAVAEQVVEEREVAPRAAADERVAAAEVWQRRRWRRQGWCGGEGGGSRSFLPDACGVRSRCIGSTRFGVLSDARSRSGHTWRRSATCTFNQMA